MINTSVLISLSQIKPGWEIGIDSRSRGRDDGIADLADSIIANGLLEPLGVWRDAVDWYVVFGNRRYQALQMVADRTGDDPATMLVPCRHIDAEKHELLALSQVENIERLGLHPVDQYEAFSGMEKAGMSRTVIGQRFGLTAREVQQRLALGLLAPEIRAAWAAGEINEETARSFTLLRDLKKQAKLYKDLPQWNRHAAIVRRMIVGDVDQFASQLKFVGRGAYEAAGGEIDEDLFGEEDGGIVRSPDVLALLVGERCREIAKGLVAGGWKWAEFEGDLADKNDMYRWPRMHPQAQRAPDVQARMDELVAVMEDEETEEDAYNAASAEWDSLEAQAAESGYTAEQKATRGCVVSVAYDGTPEIRMGLQRPEDAEPAATGAGKKAKTEKADKGGEPAAALEKAREAQTAGLGAALALDTTAAKIALVATMDAMLRGKHGGPLRLDLPHGHGASEVKGDDFEDTVAAVRAMSPSELDRTLAQLVGRLVDSRTSGREGWGGFGVTDAGVTAVATLLDADKLAAAIRSALDLPAYFGAARKDVALTAVGDVSGSGKGLADVALGKRKKAEIEAAAVEVIGDLPWLPPSIRFPGYHLPVMASIAKAAMEAEKNVKAKRASRKAKAEAKADAA